MFARQSEPFKPLSSQELQGDGGVGARALAAVSELEQFLKRELAEVRGRLEQVECTCCSSSVSAGQVCRLEQQVADLAHKQEQQRLEFSKVVIEALELEQEARQQVANEVRDVRNTVTAAIKSAAAASAAWPAVSAAAIAPGSKVMPMSGVSEASTAVHSRAESLATSGVDIAAIWDQVVRDTTVPRTQPSRNNDCALGSSISNVDFRNAFGVHNLNSGSAGSHDGMALNLSGGRGWKSTGTPDSLDGSAGITLSGITLSAGRGSPRTSSVVSLQSSQQSSCAASQGGQRKPSLAKFMTGTSSVPLGQRTTGKFLQPRRSLRFHTYESDSVGASASSAPPLGEKRPFYESGGSPCAICRTGSPESVRSLAPSTVGRKESPRPQSQGSCRVRMLDKAPPGLANFIGSNGQQAVGSAKLATMPPLFGKGF